MHFKFAPQLNTQGSDLCLVVAQEIADNESNGEKE